MPQPASEKGTAMGPQARKLQQLSLSTLLLPSPLIPPRHLVISPHAVNNGLQILTKAMAEMIIHPSKRLL